jgi:Signal transduction histidine kinase
LDTDGTVIEVNQTALEFGGLEHEAVVGKQFDDISWWTDDEVVRGRLQEAIQSAANGESSRYETQMHGVAGLKTIDFSVRPVDDANGSVANIVVEGRDITGQEQQRQHLQVIQRIIRHNMRNDIAKLRGWTQQLAQTEAAATRKTHAERVTKVLDSWTKITSDLADIRRRIGADKKPYPTVSVEALIADLVERKRSADPEATITVSLPEQSANAVPNVVDEAFDELVDNAIAATNGDSQEVDIDVDCDGEWTYVTISDNGPGLPQMEASVLETGEETPLTHGQGLGVWKVRMLIKQAGGDVSVDASDSGTTVRIQLPPAPRDSSQQETPGPVSA